MKEIHKDTRIVHACVFVSHTSSMNAPCITSGTCKFCHAHEANPGARKGNRPCHVGTLANGTSGTKQKVHLLWRNDKKINFTFSLMTSSVTE